MREPCAVKIARTVLGRRRQSNLLLLFDRNLRLGRDNPPIKTTVCILDTEGLNSYFKSLLLFSVLKKGNKFVSEKSDDGKNLLFLHLKRAVI